MNAVNIPNLLNDIRYIISRLKVVHTFESTTARMRFVQRSDLVGLEEPKYE